MADRDYYEVLGVSRTDNDEEIRRAYRKKAMEFHPDRNKEAGAEAKFKEVNSAYQVLSDTKKRAQYDSHGHAGVGANGGFDRPFDGFDVFGGFGDIFDSFFGDTSGRRTREAQPGRDLSHRVSLSFDESVFGAEREVAVTRLERCQRCSGAGNEPGTPINNCTTCRGSGQVRRAQRSIFGQFAQIIACTTCKGAGQVIQKPCNICRGAGMEQRERKISVKIPAGVEDGMQVRLSGEGDVGSRGGPPGNLYVRLNVKRHNIFSREGNDLLYILPVNVAEAALGVEKNVPTLDGEDGRIKVPPGTQPGAEFRIKGKGVPHLNLNRRGDLRILVDLKVPDRLNAEQRSLLEQLALSIQNDGGYEDNEGEGGFDHSPAEGVPDGSSNSEHEPRVEANGSADESKDNEATTGRRQGKSTGDKDKGIFERIKDSLG
jgi:molecular chaperone DnaJ